MNERWAVAYGMEDFEKNAYLWARQADGEIAVFQSKTDAWRWVLMRSDPVSAFKDILLVRIPAKKDIY